MGECYQKLGGNWWVCELVLKDRCCLINLLDILICLTNFVVTKIAIKSYR